MFPHNLNPVHTNVEVLALEYGNGTINVGDKLSLNIDITQFGLDGSYLKYVDYPAEGGKEKGE